MDRCSKTAMLGLIESWCWKSIGIEMSFIQLDGD
jgi:hypothetical protein